MTEGRHNAQVRERLIWTVLFGFLALYVASRMSLFAIEKEVVVPEGMIRLPNTFASVDHPFHTARAESLWRELGSGQLLRWVGQHQGGYPVEFYPLGEAWLEVAVRAFTLGILGAQGAHTITPVIALFLLPGIAFTALAKIDRLPLAAALLALALHVSLPGGWYDGGYTELVQWGLVTNVAGAVAALLMFPALIRFLNAGAPWTAAVASALGAMAIYCNPRSLVGLVALGIGAWVAAVRGTSRSHAPEITGRLAAVAVVAAMLAAPELLALLRFGALYTFVRYSGYESTASYLATTVGAVSAPVLATAIAGIAFALIARNRVAMSSVAASLALYVSLTVSLTFIPAVGRLASQLEPTRLMPLQRLLMIYLAAATVFAVLSWFASRHLPRHLWIAPVIVTTLAVGVLVVQTRPMGGPMPDPASPAIPSVSLYPVAMSAQPEQADLEAAIRAADEAAEPGTAILVLGSALSWHQQLWAPLWSMRPLYYDNWLWYWHPLHSGTPGYRPVAGHHYPDPEQTLVPGYLARHGIGAVVATGTAQDAASRASNLRVLRRGIYDAYSVTTPVTTITFGDVNANSMRPGNQLLEAHSSVPGSSIEARINWHPRWAATVGGWSASLVRRDDGYMKTSEEKLANAVELRYEVQNADWIARGLAVFGIASVAWLATGRRIHSETHPYWYPRPSDDRTGGRDGAGASVLHGDDVTASSGGR